MSSGPTLRLLAYCVLAYLIYLMALITLQYVPARPGVAFLGVKDISSDRRYLFAFFAHVYTSIFVIAAGATQFSAGLRHRFPGWHRGVGKIYVLLILIVAAPSGLVMAIFANGGWTAQLSFLLQATFWWWFTWRALVAARHRRWVLHRNFMLRSYALTLSAISLRLFKWIIVATLAPPPMDTYRVVAWLGWLMNLAVVEWWIRRLPPSLSTTP